MARRQPVPATPTATPWESSRSERKARQRTDKAYELLATQPVSLAGLSPKTRGEVVVSAVRDDTGNIVVLSRVKDMEWGLWPFVTKPNIQGGKKRFNWSVIPKPYREACQNVLYAYWKLGREGWSLPEVGTLRVFLVGLRVFCRYVASLGLPSLADLQPLHIVNFVHIQKARGLAPSTLKAQFHAVEILYLFRAEHEGTLRFHPWPDSSARDMAGMTMKRSENTRKVGFTPLIPVDVAQTLFLYAEGILNCAEEWLDKRDWGARTTFKELNVTSIRDACFYLTGVLTGMRSSELSSIEVGAGRSETKNGVTFHWLASIEHKTKKRAVEYLMPAMGYRLLHVMERWSAPLRERLAEQIATLEMKSGKRTADELQWLATARSNRNRLFIGSGSKGIGAISDSAWGSNLKQFARAAGTEWALAPHQMRRLYAYTFVRHRLGDLLFLKEQFKHSSIDMSQLYCANPRQDTALYDDILTELIQYKAKVVAQWLEKDEPLAGGAGRKVMALRAHDFVHRKELITETSRRVNMRSTGHSWCLAQDEGCGGSGIYAKGSCSTCHSGLIDSRFVPVWQEAYRHHKELLEDAEALGLGAMKRVTEDLARAAKILTDLGLDPGEGEEVAQSTDE
ncbi:tyrosine-type recombinase/integrase [Chromobacterium haemolyticum]|uniref:tyrosine-type recombinase/integrase n=1 Tax=Chromobacterium haemolyticum TaxID=394935 RepID=UPI00244AF299|nr:tyrosine-type recombinase/integrase [Chromobacterium haemolyticum]MDH0344568.1 site-specific integrase [Chromobacterium haemolyticum]